MPAVDTQFLPRSGRILSRLPELAAQGWLSAWRWLGSRCRSVREWCLCRPWLPGVPERQVPETPVPFPIRFLSCPADGHPTGLRRSQREGQALPLPALLEFRMCRARHVQQVTRCVPGCLIRMVSPGSISMRPCRNAPRLRPFQFLLEFWMCRADTRIRSRTALPVSMPMTVIREAVQKDLQGRYGGRALSGLLKLHVCRADTARRLRTEFTDPPPGGFAVGRQR